MEHILKQPRPTRMSSRTCQATTTALEALQAVTKAT